MKTENKELLERRAENALLNLYHNATPSWPRFDSDKEAEIFWNWLEDQASCEIDYLNSGGAWGERSSMAAYFDKKYKAPRTAIYALKKWLRARDYEQSKYARHERITDYGKLYTWGRGGRTLSPDGLICGGAYWRIDLAAAEEWPAAKLVELILVVEAFNAYVEAWNKGVPQLWAEWVQDNAEIFSDAAEEECHV